jgi:hypothetical protein
MWGGMSLSDLASIGSFVSSIAVLASLVLLYFQLAQVSAQIKLGEKNQRSIIEHGRSSRVTEVLIQIASESTLADAVDKGMTGAPDMTQTQFNQFRFYALARLAVAEDTFLQHQNGQMSDAAFTSFARIFGGAFGSAGFRVHWKAVRRGYDSDFVTFCDDLMAKARPIGSNDFAQWNANVAVEKTLGETP